MGYHACSKGYVKCEGVTALGLAFAIEWNFQLKERWSVMCYVKMKVLTQD